MSEQLAALTADKNWAYIAWCYALLLATVLGLCWRAVRRLRHWARKAAREEAEKP